MLTSFAFLLLTGMTLSFLFKKVQLPGLLGLIITGVVLGPSFLNVLDEKLLLISSDLRQLALIIILTRAGLNLNIDDLKKIGRPAFLLCFLPGLAEIGASILIGPAVLGITAMEAALLGSVIAAVSPAVVVPGMLKLMENKKGTDKNIPQMIMAGASVDDVFVIVVFYAFLSLVQTGTMDFSGIFKIPVSIVSGIISGILTGLLLSFFFKKVHIRDSAKVLVILSVSFLLMGFESAFSSVFPISGLLAVMSTGITLLKTYPVLAQRLSSKYAKLWVFAEIMLFVLVGAALNIGYLLSAGLSSVLFILAVLLFRIIGVFLCLIKTNLNVKEKCFCAAAYIPKATVQAAIGPIPLALGLDCGPLILTVAVTSIVITAPIGAVGIELGGKYLLNKETL